MSESGANANSTYTAGDGSSNAGDTYSYGTTSTTERAFGVSPQWQSRTADRLKLCEQHGRCHPIARDSYTGEEWRLGTVTRTDSLQFQLSTDATSLTTGTWTRYTSLDFATPNTTTIGAKDGNNPSNRLPKNFTITGVNILNGGTFFIRWQDFDAPGADDGLAIDDFSLIPRITTDVRESTPMAFALQQNYPNPFNPTTTIRYSIPSHNNSVADGMGVTGSYVTLKVYDQLGSEVAILVDGVEQPGDKFVLYDASRLASGMYFYVLESEKRRDIKKLFLLK